MRLRPFYDRYFLDRFHDEADPRTIASYRETLGHWEHLSPDPPIAVIDAEMLGAWKRRLLVPDGPSPRRRGGQLSLFDEPPRTSRRGRPRAIRSKATANKHLRQFTTILIKAGPPGPKNWDALGVIRTVPWVRRYKLPKRRPRVASDDELTRLWRAAQAAKHPEVDGISAVAWWRAFVLCAVTTGFRHEALLGLQWSGVDLAGATITLDAASDKRDEDRQKPLHPLLVQHLLPIRTAAGPVFPWPRSETTFYRQWRALVAAAGIVKRLVPHDLKRTCGTRLSATGSPWTVQFMLDHASIETSQVYVDGADQARPAVEAIRLPAVFYGDTG